MVVLEARQWAQEWAVFDVGDGGDEEETPEGTSQQQQGGVARIGAPFQTTDSLFAYASQLCQRALRESRPLARCGQARHRDPICVRQALGVILHRLSVGGRARIKTGDLSVRGAKKDVRTSGGPEGAREMERERQADGGTPKPSRETNAGYRVF
jgi:hypothetical protein